MSRRLLCTGVVHSRDMLSKLWAALVPDASRFVRKGVKESVPSVDNALVMACFNIMDALLKPFVRYCSNIDLHCRLRPSAAILHRYSLLTGVL